jgi:hypothetical protein
MNNNIRHKQKQCQNFAMLEWKLTSRLYSVTEEGVMILNPTQGQIN